MMLWQDNIMGQSPLSKNEAIKEIKNFLMQQGILTLADILTWDDSEKWRNWEIPQVLEQLCSQKTLLEEALMGWHQFTCVRWINGDGERLKFTR